MDSAFAAWLVSARTLAALAMSATIAKPQLRHDDPLPARDGVKMDEWRAMARLEFANRMAARFGEAWSPRRKAAITSPRKRFAARLAAGYVTAAGRASIAAIADLDNLTAARLTSAFGGETPVSVRSAAVSPTPPAKPDSSRRRCARRRHKAAPITLNGSQAQRQIPDRDAVPGDGRRIALFQRIKYRPRARSGGAAMPLLQPAPPVAPIGRRVDQRAAARSRCPSASSAGAQIGISHSSNSLAAAVLAPKWPLPSRMAQS